jgi:hypothetical protein
LPDSPRLSSPVWSGLIVKWTDYEMRIAAWVIGLLPGWGVHLAVGRRIRPELFSSRTRNLFWDSKCDVFSFFDVIWIGLAVFTAARVAMASYGRRRTTTV